MFQILFFSLFLNLSPFFFELPTHEESEELFLKKIEEQMQNSSIQKNIDSLFLMEKEKLSLDDSSFLEMKEHLYQRVLMGCTQKLFSNDQTKRLVKVNKGSNRCIVTTIDGSKKRNPELISQMLKNLEAIGYDGYVYFRIGGFPNPTGKEMQYAAVPYSFKIFLMLEAKNLGFPHVLWVDARLMPLRSLDPIFLALKSNRAFLVKDKIMSRVNFTTFSLSHLEKITGINPLVHYRIATPVFGLDFSYPPVEKFLQDYYACCESGFPFLSVFPEEHVLSAIFAKYCNSYPLKAGFGNQFKHLWHYDDSNSLIQHLDFALKRHFFFFGLGNNSQYLIKSLEMEKKIQKQP
ncbi:MAG: hypothetical protein FJZ61_02015 [Chlamydiae bacterium]|nr:hypothetical protein [Chlamydiota bacterium]